jgi:hypothetical protein
MIARKIIKLLRMLILAAFITIRYWIVVSSEWLLKWIVKVSRAV